MTKERQAEIFAELQREHGLRSSALAAWTGASLSEAKRWICGANAMPLHALAAFCRACPSGEMREALLAALLEGTDALVVFLSRYAQGSSVEVDGHLRPPPDLADIARRFADSIERHTRAVGDGRISGDEAQAIGLSIENVVRECVRFKARLERNVRASALRFPQARAIAPRAEGGGA